MQVRQLAQLYDSICIYESEPSDLECCAARRPDRAREHVSSVSQCLGYTNLPFASRVFETQK